LRLDLIKALNEERAGRRAAIVVTEMASGAQRLVKAADAAQDPLKDLLDKHFRSGKSAMVDLSAMEVMSGKSSMVGMTGKSGIVGMSGKSGMAGMTEGQVFLTVHVPSPRLVITGAVHISQSLAPIAALLGYDVTIVDPRTAFASLERFPDVKFIAEWPDAALPPLNIDRYTAFVALTHDPKIDDPALLHALARDCFYIGALGSRKTHARRVERLKAAGVTDNNISRIHAPIGLDIGAVSPAEIAVSIIGEITARLRQGDNTGERLAGAAQ
jgi:xanthine dehydrogenase accessory factor